MRIDIITGFPKILEQPLNESIIKMGRRKAAVDIHIHDLRDFTTDRHRTIDDYPYGGGPGMVLKIEPFYRALKKIFETQDVAKAHIVLPSPRGRTLTQSVVTELSIKEHLVFLCGHYKGIDERIHEFFKIDEISIGDYILSSGEVATLVMIDAMVRLLPGVIKDINSAWTDSFSDDLLDVPYYTRPEEFEGKKVPPVLLSGNHQKIAEWRQKMREKITRQRRPDLYEKYLKSIK
ncbi:tRNA (guanine-N(1)-)-methyltransferase [Caldithrix abyssi DSM 13497]|uniref:tRNA (guanine-N(1)-)-methyltransferase n=1 Tax=Caldithrix abyssi DSM 13497 TaxID=880073 RepID=H1XUW7_CALAY|nr:tRNA (guanosine(37)-N1)-methyltransferase TrmD [Caldithrix abyssi]APF17572.1 trmD tRNA (Guanine37-N(1)-) methyltransferase [Caldithrix abyssi DSM 13497]EHO41666.1 tRNA (guanine-N(1)-)-methyltransferase [Caldithrix abyssi DSM 13497]